MGELTLVAGGRDAGKRHMAEQTIGLRRRAKVEPAQGRTVAGIRRQLETLGSDVRRLAI
jgi:hypothetical protein